MARTALCSPTPQRPSRRRRRPRGAERPAARWMPRRISRDASPRASARSGRRRARSRSAPRRAGRHGRGPARVRGARPRAARRRRDFLAALSAGAIAAAAVGALLASRITRPVEALRAAAARVAGGDLRARVETRATGEVGELVRAFNAMTADLAASRVSLAQAERVAAWREVARRLAHEIKNPLTPIAMSVETLRDAHARAPSGLRRDLRRGHARHRRGGPAAEAYRRRVQPVRAAARARAHAGRARRARPVGARAVPRPARGRDRRAGDGAGAASRCSPIAIRWCRCS